MGIRGALVPQSVEAFEPPFCPNPDCAHHQRGPKDPPWPWEGRGLRTIARNPKVVRQLRCGACGRWFRSSVFGPDYWKKVAGLSAKIYDALHAGEGLRQAARHLKRAPTTIRRHVRLIAKQCVQIHYETGRQLMGQLDEKVCLDGLRTFAGSQWEPLDINLAVLQKSSFLLDVTVAGLRRSGRMTEKQKAIREVRDARLGVPEPGARTKAVREMVDRMLELAPQGFTLVTDEEPDYARAIEHAKERITHETVSSKARRDGLNPLMRSNVLDLYARHAVRALVRETIAFAKASGSLYDRMWIFAVLRILTKGISEKTAALSKTTPAMVLGLATKRRYGKAVLKTRRFPKRVGLPPALEAAYLGTCRVRPHEPVNPYIHRFVA